MISKVLEGLVCKWVRQAVEDRFNPRQLGATRGTSTTHALVELTHYTHTELDKPGHHVRTLLLDYSKAFDMANHHILLRKIPGGRYPRMSYQMVRRFSAGASTAREGGPGVVLPVTINGGAPSLAGYAAWSLGIHCLPR